MNPEEIKPEIRALEAKSEKAECPTCAGDGWTYALSTMDIEVECPRCLGTGRIELRQPQPNDEAH